MLIYTLKCPPNKEHVRHILLLEFHKGNTASSAAAKTLKDTYGNDIVNERTAEDGFLQELTESFDGTKAYFKRRGQNEESSFSYEYKLAKFYEEGMRKLMARWKDVINKNGDYVEH
ncbi:hypothetical protein ACTXT7_001147 [Hymenolepis weldensis]